MLMQDIDPSEIFLKLVLCFIDFLRDFVCVCVEIAVLIPSM